MVLVAYRHGLGVTDHHPPAALRLPEHRPLGLTVQRKRTTRRAERRAGAAARGELSPARLRSLAPYLSRGVLA